MKNLFKTKEDTPSSQSTKKVVDYTLMSMKLREEQLTRLEGGS